MAGEVPLPGLGGERRRGGPAVGLRAGLGVHFLADEPYLGNSRNPQKTIKGPMTLFKEPCRNRHMRWCSYVFIPFCVCGTLERFSSEEAAPCTQCRAVCMSVENSSKKLPSHRVHHALCRPAGKANGRDLLTQFPCGPQNLPESSEPLRDLLRHSD